MRSSTSGRHPAFVDRDTVAEARRLLLQQAEQQQFEILAYCFMPDHVHVLLEARSEQTSLCQMVRRWKQASGFWYARRHRRTLWQSGYFERILRRDEATEIVANYIVANPVRAHLTKLVGEYPYAWSRTSVLLDATSSEAQD